MTKLIVALIATLTLLTACGSVQIRLTGQPTITRHFQVFPRICQMGESRHSSVTGPRGTTAQATDTVFCSFVDNAGRLCQATIQYTTDMRTERGRDGTYVAVPEETIRRNMVCSYENRYQRRRW